MKSFLSSQMRNSAICSLFAALAVSGAQAADGTWTQITSGTASGTWSDAVTGNWAGGNVAGGSGSTANFATLDVSGTSTVALGAPRTIGNLIFGDTGTATAGNWVLSGTGANFLTLQGTTPTITINAMSPVNNTSSNVTISTIIAGTSGLTVNGTGTNSINSANNTQGTSVLTLSGSNTYTGATNIEAGTTVRAANALAFGGTAGGKAATNVVNVANGGRLTLSAVNIGNTVNLNGNASTPSVSALAVVGGNSTLSGLVNVQSNALAYVHNGGNYTLTFSGTVNLGTNTLTIATTGQNNGAIISGVLLGSGGITKNGAGPLTMSGDGSGYTGLTTLSSGELVVGSSNALGTGTLALNPGNNNAVVVRSTDATARTIATAVTINSALSGTYTFGSVSTGNLTFSNTTAIAVTSGRTFTVLNSQTQFDAGFSGAGGSIVKSGTGTLVLNGANTYTGVTTVSAGTLLVNGSLDNASVVTVSGSAGLGGTGIVGGNTTISGTLAPGALGASTESLAFGGNLTLTNTSNAVLEINGTNRGSGVNGYDAIDLTNASGLLTYDGTLTLTMSGLVADGTYDLFSFTAAAAGSFDAINFAGGAYTGTFIQSGSLWTATSAQGQTFTFNQVTGDLTVVPEPTTAVLLGTGLMTVLVMRRRQRQG